MPIPDPPPDPPPDDVRITLRPLPSGVPAHVRIRRALKCLLRAFGLRNVRLEWLPREGGREGSDRG
jgi:hypothetical protein